MTATDRPVLSRQMPCPACGPGHEHHTPLPCDHPGCGCTVVPIPGVYP